MSAKVVSVGLKGLEGYRIEVEVQVKEGFESIVIVGLPDASVKESKERVSAALHTLGFPLVEKKVIINLSPAEQKKNGALFDLAIALGMLKSGGIIQDKIPMMRFYRRIVIVRHRDGSCVSSVNEIVF